MGVVRGATGAQLRHPAVRRRSASPTSSPPPSSIRARSTSSSTRRWTRSSIEQSLRAKNLSDQVPLLQRYWTWLTDIVLHWDWGESPKGGSVNDEVSRRIWVSLRLITIGSLVGIVVGVVIGAWTATRQYKLVRPVLHDLRLAVHPLGARVRHRQRAAGAGRPTFNNATGLRIFEFVGETGRARRLLRCGAARPAAAPGAADHRADPDQRRVLQPDPAQPDAGLAGLGLRPDRPGQGSAAVAGP